MDRRLLERLPTMFRKFLFTKSSFRYLYETMEYNLKFKFSDQATQKMS